MALDEPGAVTPAHSTRDAWTLLTLEPLKGMRDRRYVDCSEARNLNVSKKLYNTLSLHDSESSFMHLLVTGYRGDGKTTELYQFMQLIDQKYRPLYFNAEVDFDILDFGFPDFMLGVARAVHDHMKRLKLELSSDLVEGIANWFAKTVEVVEQKSESEVKAEGGAGTPSWFPWVTAKLVATIKAGGGKRTEVRRELNQNLTQLIAKTDALISEAVKVSKDADGKPLVLIYDSLDRLDPDHAFDLFHTNGRNIRELKCHSVYVVPISLMYHVQTPTLPFDERIEMPIIPVRNRNGSENTDNIRRLEELLQHRFVPDEIMTESDVTTRELILTSGGMLRDLVRMFKQACGDALSEPDEKISPSVARRVMNGLGQTYQRAIVLDDEQALIKTYKNKATDNNERTQKLIYNTVILSYDDEGVKWQDVHPALSCSQRFQALIAESG